MGYFKKNTDIMSGSGEWDESEHPRDSDGKFTANGASTYPQNTKYDDIIKMDKERSLTKEVNGDKLIIDTAEAKQLYDDISSGKYYSREELANHPTVIEMERLAESYKDKYGDTNKINTAERKAKREQWANEFMSMGSARKIDKGYVYDGAINRQYKAVIAIGLPAAGKSTLLADPNSQQLGAFIFDSDEVKKRIDEFKATNGAAASCVHNESKSILEKCKEQFLTGSRNGENLVIPVIGDEESGLFKKWITPLENAGYSIEVKFQDADPIASLNRVVKRGLKDGRIIPMKIVGDYEDKPRDVFNSIKKKFNSRGERYVKE